MKWIIFIAATLLLIGCGIDSRSSLGIRNGSENPVYDPASERGANIFGILLRIPDNFFIREYEDTDHIVHAIIANDVSSTVWPGTNRIELTEIVPILYSNPENYLATICVGQTHIEPGKDYDMEVIKETSGVRVVKIHRNCVTDDGHYSVPDNTEYLIVHDDRAIKVRIDEEADAAAMEHLELLMKTAEKAL